MSLFVGNISKYVKSFELEDEFNRFGRCEIKRNVSNVSQALLRPMYPFKANAKLFDLN